MRPVRHVVPVAALLAMIPGSALAQDICPKGCPFPTIQAAVDSVKVGDTQRFDVAGVTLRENVVVADRTVRLFGEAAATPTYAPADPDQPVFTVTNGKLVLNTFVLDADFTRGIDATDSEIDLTTGALFGRGLAGPGAIVRVSGGELALLEVTARDGTASGRGGIVYAENAEVSIIASNFDGGSALDGGCLAVRADQPHTLSLLGVVFRQCTATFDGGAMRVEGPVTVDGAGVSMQAGTARRGGGLAALGGATLTLATSELTGNSAFQGGGAAYVDGSSLTLSGAALASNTAPTGGAVQVAGGTLALDVVGFAGNEAFDNGGAVFLQGSTIDSIDAAYLRNGALGGRGGGLYLGSGSTVVRQVRSTFCRNQAGLGGGAYTALDDDSTWSNVRFIDNDALLEGGGLSHFGDGTLTLSFANFLGNSAGQGSGAALLAEGAVHLDDTLVAWSTGATAAVARDGGSVSRGRTAWFANDEGDLAGLPPNDPDALFGDPLLDRYTPGTPCEVVQDWPGISSALRDAGRSDEVFEDLDGTRADLGAYGGPDAPADVWEIDRDDDGFAQIDDCDDGNDQVYPGAADSPYDGLDADCRRDDDYDADGDGFQAIDYGGVDCDDADPAIYPDAPEDPAIDVDMNCDDVLDADLDGVLREEDCDDGDPSVYPGAPEDDGPVDRDCDGFSDGPRIFQLTTCATGPAVPGAGWLAGLVALIARRRAEP